MQTRKFTTKGDDKYPSRVVEIPVVTSGRDERGRAVDPREDVYLMGIPRFDRGNATSKSVTRVTEPVTHSTESVTEKSCQNCGSIIPETARGGAYCSNACKQKAYRKMKQKEA